MNRRNFRNGALVGSVTADQSAVNTTTQTNVAQMWLPPWLKAGDALRLQAYGDLLNNSGGAVTYTLTLLLGATSFLDTSPTTLMASNAWSVAANANRAKWMAGADVIVATDKTNSTAGTQRAGMHFMLTAQSATALPITTGAASAVGYGTGTVDMTRSQPLALAVTLGTANASADFYCHFATLTLHRP